MRVALFPFHSQKDKRSGAVQTTTCGSTKQASFVARKLREAGHSVAALCANGYFNSMFEDCHRVPAFVPSDNYQYRHHWDWRELMDTASGADAAICWHEHLAIPLRAMFPELRIFQLCAVKPDPSDMFLAAWRRATKVVVQTETMSRTVQAMMHPVGMANVLVWPMCWDEERIGRGCVPRHSRDIDVLFVQRCSATNYTHHKEFLAAMPQMQHLRVAFVDVTRYLRKERPDLEYVEPEGYLDALQRSKVAIALNDDGFGGQAIREAIACGCLPVVKHAECYFELCGGSWPFVVWSDFGNLANVIGEAVAAANANFVCGAPLRNALAQSYQRTWPTIAEDLGL